MATYIKKKSINELHVISFLIILFNNDNDLNKKWNTIARNYERIEKLLLKGIGSKFDMLDNRSLLIQNMERNLTQEARKYSRDIVFKREYSFHPVKRSARRG